VLIYDGRQVRVYIDGKEDKVIFVPGGLRLSDTRLNIGRMGNGKWHYGFTGKLDDLIVCNRSLTEVEVLGLWST